MNWRTRMLNKYKFTPFMWDYGIIAAKYTSQNLSILSVLNYVTLNEYFENGIYDSSPGFTFPNFISKISIKNFNII